MNKFEVYASHVVLVHVAAQLHTIIFGPGSCSNNGHSIESRVILMKKFGAVRLAGLNIETRMFSDLLEEAIVRPVGWPKNSLIEFELFSCRSGAESRLDTFIWHADIVTVSIPGLFNKLPLGTMDIPPFFTLPSPADNEGQESELRLFIELLDDVQWARAAAV